MEKTKHEEVFAILFRKHETYSLTFSPCNEPGKMLRVRLIIEALNFEFIVHLLLLVVIKILKNILPYMTFGPFIGDRDYRLAVCRCA